MSGMLIRVVAGLLRFGLTPPKGPFPFGRKKTQNYRLIVDHSCNQNSGLLRLTDGRFGGADLRKVNFCTTLSAESEISVRLSPGV